MTVLLVEDDDAIRSLMARMLTILGCWVETASNGLEGVDLFLSDKDRFDLVVTDIQMPVLDGYEAVRQIRKVRPQTPVVCMSGADSVTLLPGTAFLSKPFTLAEVQDCVHKALAGQVNCAA
jgi:CheY-like chemotaxis protein